MAIDTIKSTAVLDGAIATADIADDAVTADKLANSINTNIAAKSPIASPSFTGNVGIGLATPLAPVVALTTVTSNEDDIVYGMTQSNNNAGRLVGMGIAATGSVANMGVSFYTCLSSVQSERMRINEQGRMGIGTITPDAFLSVDSNVGGSSTGTLARFHSSKGESDSTFLNIAATRHGTPSVQRVQLQAFDDDASTGRTLALNPSGGPVAINTNTQLTSSKLSLQTDVDGNGMGINAFKSSNSNYYMMNFRVNTSTEVGNIYSNGSSTTYATSSDYRLKENVDYTWDATTRLKQLKPARFNFINDETDTLVDGFIAHEVQNVVPESILGTHNGMKDEEYEVTPAVLDDDGNETTAAVMGTRSVPFYQGIDQSKLVPLLVKTIQELESRITALEDA